MFAITKKRGIGERGEKGDKEKLKEATWKSNGILEIPKHKCHATVPLQTWESISVQKEPWKWWEGWKVFLLLLSRELGKSRNCSRGRAEITLQVNHLPSWSLTGETPGAVPRLHRTHATTLLDSLWLANHPAQTGPTT
jgi:hypothetical protein